jgi:hypothetical protein
MSQIISVSLPIRFQSLCIPSQWTIPIDDKDENPTFEAKFTKSPVSTYDAWEKRNEFFRLKEGDNVGLLNFLDSVGLWNRLGQGDDPNWEAETREFTHEGLKFVVEEQPWREPDEIWHIREHARIALSSKARLDVLGQFELPTRLVLKRTGSYFLICTVAFLDALFATIVLDHAEGARVQRCARPDCGVVFAANNRHRRKYCTWDCAHLVAVRKSRLPKKHKSA